MEKEYLTSAEVCALLHICKTTLQQFNKNGLEKAKRVIGGKHLYVASEVHQFINNQGGLNNEQ